MERTLTSEILKMHSKIAVQMKDQAFNGKDSVSVINFLPEFNRACDTPRIYKVAVVWTSRKIDEWYRSCLNQGAVDPAME